MARGRRDERGGAVSLWVLLMAPVSAFAAVVAMAGPQRLAAESSVQDAADDLAAFTVAARDGQSPGGALLAFPPECVSDNLRTGFDDRMEDLETRIADLQEQIDALGPPPPSEDPAEELRKELKDEQDGLRRDLTGLRVARDERREQWRQACDLMFEALVRDLGHLGVDMGSVRGFYSDSLVVSVLWPGPATCSIPSYSTEDDCKHNGGSWGRTPCRTAQGRVVRDAAHVALAGDWQDAGWAASQVWPDGLPMAAESVGRLSRQDDWSKSAEPCGNLLVVFDTQGRPVWPNDVSGSTSRSLAQSVPRTALSG